MTQSDGLEVFLPVVASWFREAFGCPTPPQRLGWPAIAGGRNTLIFAPTGSGKTLAAFLACLDLLWREPSRPKGVRVLYVSPLKALNQDIRRNLEHPLLGVVETARRHGVVLPHLTAAVRSGDTTQPERQRQIRRPPDILITTPESLHLLLTSRAREILRTVTHVIVDEIHAVCSNKRGVFLSLLLERLEALTPGSFIRIGLSATQRPLDEVARFLGGRTAVPGPDGRTCFEARPVVIVDAGGRKDLDLEVIAPFSDASAPRAGSVWPAIEQTLFDLIRRHRSTIVFANNRRVAERLTSKLNDLGEASGYDSVRAAGAESEALARSHHGSLSLDERRSTEDALKQGELAAVVATASLEMGIDMGAVDLVCQVESPGSVARGLQRVGRAGHVVGRISKGRLIAKTAGDLLESAALSRQMLRSEVEILRVPSNCLDVLAQQIVACVAMDRWDAHHLFDLVLQAYPYRDLPPAAFEGVLKMVSGRFPTGSIRDLRARISWDRVHNLLAALPGTAKIAVVGGGTIPDTGQYPVYVGADGPRIGELDEEFVLERRVGETFTLGTATWRIEAIDPLRVTVSRAEGRSALVPFWRGESGARTYELGRAVGQLCREVVERSNGNREALIDWLEQECRVVTNSARVIVDHVSRQRKVAGAVPDDRTVLVESFRDDAGGFGVAILTPFGGKLHHGLKLAVQAVIRERLGVEPACLHDNVGILIRLPDSDEPPLDFFEGLSADRAEGLIREGLGDSALFGLRFRQNAGRALLMPRPDPSKRSPLWLQRLRARDLLQVVRKHPDFPIVTETFRECLDDDLELPRLRAFLDEIVSGSIKIVVRRGEVSSPFVSELRFRFEHQFLYQWDEPVRSKGDLPPLGLDDPLLDRLLEGDSSTRWLDPSAVDRVDSRLRGLGRPPRSLEEMAELLRTVGDLTTSELAGPMLVFLRQLEANSRAERIDLRADPAGLTRWNGSLLVDVTDQIGCAIPSPTCPMPPPAEEAVSLSDETGRWIASEERGLYDAAFGNSGEATQRRRALESIIRRYLATHALVGLDELVARYPIDPATATDLLERWADEGVLLRIDGEHPDDAQRWAERENLSEVRRLSIAFKRRESMAVSPEVFADFLLRRQGVHPEHRREGEFAFRTAFAQLQGYAAPASLWESEIYPARVRDYNANRLDERFAGGRWFWRARGGTRGEPDVAFFSRDEPLRPVFPDEAGETPDEAARVLSVIEKEGASFATDLARLSGIEPLRVRAVLDQLGRLGLVTNDRFDPLRPGARAIAEALAAAAVSVSQRARQGRPKFPRGRRDAASADGRWSRPPEASASADSESECLAWSAVLIERYGVLTRETVALDKWAPPWRELSVWLARAELRGEVRRGYFVEGLSGVQYASEEAAEALVRSPASPNHATSPVLVSTLDPANLYGSGAPFDIELLEGGTARLPRSESNFLIVIGGRPVLIVEANGKRLTGLSSATEAELKDATMLLPSLTGPGCRVLKVEIYNGVATLASPAAVWLGEAGFVRDHPGMAYYAGW